MITENVQTVYRKTSTAAPTINGPVKVATVHATDTISVSVWQNVHGHVQVELYNTNDGSRAVLTAMEELTGQ